MRGKLFTLLGVILALALPAAAQEQSLADAARKAREKKKDAPKAAKVFTNDNLPTTGKVSVEGGAAEAGKEAAAEVKPGEGQAAAGEKEEGKEPVKDAAYWRARFADLRKKLTQAEKELEVLQRELSLKQVQYYPDPQKVMEEEYTRNAVTEQRRKLDEKQAEVRQLRQQLSDLEDELRRAGGNPAWAR